ncbi:hypothetical protein SAMD00019534_011500, partial [Acytostelium subglobosum LB1]|uniref:hypothetical protein n=1 Tax=Acytostelium subglobosum LB1 TaxID=1410327 RepID=UPI000644F7DC
MQVNEMDESPASNNSSLDSSPLTEVVYSNHNPPKTLLHIPYALSESMTQLISESTMVPNNDNNNNNNSNSSSGNSSNCNNKRNNNGKNRGSVSDSIIGRTKDHQHVSPMSLTHSLSDNINNNHKDASPNTSSTSPSTSSSSTTSTCTEEGIHSLEASPMKESEKDHQIVPNNEQFSLDHMNHVLPSISPLVYSPRLSSDLLKTISASSPCVNTGANTTVNDEELEQISINNINIINNINNNNNNSNIENTVSASGSSSSRAETPKLRNRYRLTPTQVYDTFRFFIWCISLAFLNVIDSSMVYHHIRGQAVIKLYIIFNVLEVLDKLCCSFGQDIFDSLYWMSVSLTSPLPAAPSSTTGGTPAKIAKITPFGKVMPDRRMLAPFTHTLVCTGYVCVHSLVLFTQVITLNVAINSYNNSLLTLIMSNNFVELKGSVFKRFEKENLFQISCSDIVERFQIFIYLAIIFFQNLSDLSWDLNEDFVLNMMVVVASVWGAEMLVDAIKHAFITKFNKIPPNIYSKFFNILMETILDSRSRSFTESSWGITSIVGFIPFPLATVIVRIFSRLIPVSGVSVLFGGVLLVLIYLCLVCLKILIKLIILSECLRYQNSRKASAVAPVSTSTVTPSPSITGIVKKIN